MLRISWATRETAFNQSEALTRSGKWHVISMEFLRPFHKRHYAGKPVVASRNIGRFLRLQKESLSFKLLKLPIPYQWCVITQNWVVLRISWATRETAFNQSEALTRSGKWHVISMEFLRPFHKRHYAGKPVVASRNIGRFLRLQKESLSFKLLKLH